MKQPLILHIAYSGMGGQPKVAMQLAAAGNNVNEPFHHQLLFCGIETLHNYNKSFCETYNIPYQQIQKKAGFDRAFFVRLYKAMKALQPAVIVAHIPNYHFVLGWYKRNSSVKIISVEHHSIALRDLTSVWHSRLSARVANIVVALTAESKDYLLEKIKVRPDKCVVIPNGFYRQGKVLPKSYPNNESWQVLLACRMEAGKDISTVLEVAKRLADGGKKIDWHIAGGGQLLKKYKQEAQVLLLDNVSFYGHVDEGPLRELFHHAHFLVHSSVGEGFSMAIVEAMAYGLPVIGSNVTGVNSAIHPGKNGLLFTLGDADSLMGEVNKLVRNQHFYETMSKLALQDYEQHYRMEKINKLYTDLIAALLQ